MVARQRSRRTPRSRRRALIVAGVLCALVVLAALGDAVYNTQQAQRPLDTARAYCADLLSRKYADAYGLLSSAARSQISSTEYALESGLRDQVEGPVTSCRLTHGDSAPVTFLAPASNQRIPLMVTRAKTYTGDIALTQQGDAWRVSTVASALQGTDVAPLALSLRFCQALVVGNYPSAYNDLSPSEQQMGAEQDFASAYAAAFDGANGASRLTTCSPITSTYDVAADDTSASLSLTFEATPNAAIPATFTFVRVGNEWKINTIAINITQGA